MRNFVRRIDKWGYDSSGNHRDRNDLVLELLMVV